MPPFGCRLNACPLQKVRAWSMMADRKLLPNQNSLATPEHHPVKEVLQRKSPAFLSSPSTSRRPSGPRYSPRGQTTYSALPFLDFVATGTTQKITVTEAREFFVSRLSVSQRQMPGQRLLKLLQWLREVWSRLDEGKTSEPVYWLDVITEMK